MRLLFVLALGVALVSAGCIGRLDAEAPPPRSPPVLLSSEDLIGEGLPRVVVRRRVWEQSYPVAGVTAAELRRSMDRRGPYSTAERRRYDAITEWSLRWSFRFDRSSADTCSLASATLELDSVIVLPQLAGGGPPSLDLTSRWQAYRLALAEHERGHVERQQAIALELRSAWEQTDAEASCLDLAARLKALGESALAAIAAADQAFDSETAHGARQGALFP